MSFRMRMAFVCYLLGILLLVVFGVVYLIRTEFMPYHAVAVGKQWAEVPSAFQVLTLALMRSVAGGFLGVAFLMFILLVIPFRQGQRWAQWTIPAGGMIISAGSLYSTVSVALNTPANPPWIAGVAGMVLMGGGFLFSLGQFDKELNDTPHN